MRAKVLLVALVAALLAPVFALSAALAVDGPASAGSSLAAGPTLSQAEAPADRSPPTGGASGMDAVWRDAMGSYACAAWSCVLLAGDPTPDHTFPTPDGYTEATLTLTWTGAAEALRMTVASDDRVRSVAGAPGATLTLPLGDAFTVTVEDVSPFDGTGVRGGSAFAVEMTFA